MNKNNKEPIQSDVAVEPRWSFRIKLVVVHSNANGVPLARWFGLFGSQVDSIIADACKCCLMHLPDWWRRLAAWNRNTITW